MWLFTRYGFFSLACARRDGGQSSRIDPNLMMIRARKRSHLENLAGRFPVLTDLPILTDYGTDYRYRIIVPKPVWKSVMAELVEEQTWSSFKDEAERYLTDDRPYTDSLHRVWSVMGKLQTS
jgi:hypothetical protein